MAYLTQAISGFGMVRKNSYIDNTCNLQAICTRRKEDDKRRGGRGKKSNVVAAFGKIRKDKPDGYKAPRS
jgi:hypothetical protein